MSKITTYFKNVKAKYKLKNHLTYYIMIAFTVLFTILSLTGGIKKSSTLLLEQIGYFIIFAVSLSLVVGFLGELSLGHAGFICLGAYFGAFFQNSIAKGLTASAPLLSLVLAMLFGGVIAAVFGFIIGLPALRLKGDYLAIATLAFGEIVRTVFPNLNSFGKQLGLDSVRYASKTLFIVIFVVAILSVVIINNLIKSKHGRAVTAIRDNEIAARAMGVRVNYYKIMVFVLSAFLAGVGGVLYSAANTKVVADVFNYNYSINILVMVVLGGMGSINGSIISAAFITFLNIQLQSVLATNNLAPLKDLIYALILIVIVIYTNAPSLKGFREKYNFRKLWDKIYAFFHRIFRSKKELADPAIEKADAGDWSKIPTKVEMDAILSTDFTPDTSYVPDRPDKPEAPKGGKE